MGVEMVARRSRTNAMKKRMVKGVAGRNILLLERLPASGDSSNYLYLVAIDKVVADIVVVIVGSWLVEPVEWPEKRIGDTH